MVDSPVDNDRLAEAALRSLGDIIESGVLGEKSRLRQLLRYLVQEEIEGRGERLKAYTVATDIFGRGEDFDPSSDSIVRVEMNRLRQSLEHYYQTQGASAPVRILFPKGTYRPEFVVPDRDQRGGDGEGKPDQRGKTGMRSSKARSTLGPVLAAVALAGILVGGAIYYQSPDDGVDEELMSQVDPNVISVAVREIRGADENSPERSLSANIVREIRAALSRNDALKVIVPDGGSDDASAETDFVIDGTVQDVGGDRRLSVEVINVHTSTLVWARTYGFDPQQADAHEGIVSEVSRELHTRLLGASKEVLEGRDPATLSAAQLFVMATWVPGPATNTVEWEKERVRLARLAVEKDPEYGPAYSVLADKLAYLAAMDGTMNTEANLAEAKKSWERAMELAPLDANIVFNVAQGQWHSGNIAASVRSMTRVTELDPNHALAGYLSLVIPYTCAAAPDEVVDKAIAFDQSLASDNPIRWLTLTWIAWLHLYREEFDLALDAEQRAAQIFQIPYTFMRHAVLLNIKGRPEEALQIIRSQKINWPNIDPDHFASVTIPRLCQETEESGKFVSFYANLAEKIKELQPE